MAGDRMMKRILIVTEKEEGTIAPITLELLKAGALLAEQGGEIVCACVLGHDVEDLGEELALYASEVYVIDNPLLSHMHSDLHASALASLCRAISPITVLMGHTYENLEIAPKLAYRMEGDVASDCIKLERDRESGVLLCTKPIYGGNAVAVLEKDRTPQIATLRPKVMEALEKGAEKGSIIPFQCELHASTVLTIGLIRGDSVSLDKANAIVAGGGGVKTIEGLQELEDLVQALSNYFDKVSLGASRSLVDAGLLPHSRQIGQTGEKVNPQIYVAVAISGAAQHLAGVVGAKKIVAINKDPDAPIFESSDYGVVGTYEDIVPALIKKLEALT